MVHRFLCAALLAACFGTLAVAEEPSKAKFLGREWVLTKPDSVSVAQSDGDGGLVLADRGCASTKWVNGKLDFEFMYFDKAYMKPEDRVSHSTHLSISPRASGQLTTRPFELTGTTNVRLRLASGQVLLEQPSNKPNEDPVRLEDKAADPLAPFTWHHVVLTDEAGKLTLVINTKAVLKNAVIGVTADECLLSISPREFVGGPNTVLIRPYRARKQLLIEP